MPDWLRQLLALSPREQLVRIEERELSLEERLERLIGQLLKYKKKNAEELEQIMADLSAVLDILDKIILALEHIGGAERAQQLRKRLRGHRTRARRAHRELTGRVHEPAA